MRNYLIKGSSGTGKTYLARAAAYYICQEKIHIEDVFSKNIAKDLDDIEKFVQSSRCEYVQVHASMGYEDLVYGASIQAEGNLNISYAEKRIKRLCDRAQGNEDLFCVIFDDISRTNSGAFLGNLLYAMEYRNEPVDLGEGHILIVPDNVVFIFTECDHFKSEHLDYALRRRMDYTVKLYPNRAVLEQYFSDSVGAIGTNIILEVFDTICRLIDRSIVSEYKGSEKEYYPGHGMFIVEQKGTPYYILDNLRHKIIYQVFPYVRELQKNGILRGEVEPIFDAIKAKINTGIAGLNNIVSVQKILAKSGKVITPYTLEDVKNYYTSTIIPGQCKDYKGMLEGVIDAIILNGIFPHDVAMSALLTNTDIAAIPSKINDGVYASYLVNSQNAADFYYETARKGRPRAPHRYYSMACGNVGRWVPERDVAAYKISYADGTEPQMFLPLNGLRVHTFTIENVCKVDNPAEIYGALYRLAYEYLNAYTNNIALIKGVDTSLGNLEEFVRLEIRYLAALHEHLPTITANTQSERERARINFFGTKLLMLRSLWNEKGATIAVDGIKFTNLVNGNVAFTLSSFEDMFIYDPDTVETIELKGVVKMTDLRDYQAIMENIGVRQMVFQGPPGTSKTFESKKFVLKQLNPESPVFENAFVSQVDISAALADYKLTEEDYTDPIHSEKLSTGGWDLVQFHPSYGYEDFIRGIEVKTPNGVPTYNTVNRILGKIAAFAKMAEAGNPQCPPKFYLIVDEINRANLATVFGELIYGLEYRNSKVSTPYEVDDLASNTKTRDIVLGKNLFIIGTMNTADKSIDAIDYAIRRRFIFIDSLPDRNVVTNCYKNVSGHDDENSIEILLFDAIQSIFDSDRYFNSDYQKNDVKLGHTYFLRKKSDGYADDIVEHMVFQVLPILKEYVKDGILDTSEDLVSVEHSIEEICNAPDAIARYKMLGDNIMVYAKEYGNTCKFGSVIDNAYVGTFVETLREKLNY